MKKVLVLHGPNLNLTGIREPGTYGTVTLEQINREIESLGEELGIACRIVQSNHEGVLIDEIHTALTEYDGILINAGAEYPFIEGIRVTLRKKQKKFV